LNVEEAPMPGIRERLRSGREPQAGFLNLLPSAVATQALAAAGADVVVIDLEHGPIGRKVEAVNHAERVILDAGIPLGGAALNQQQTHALVEKGYRLLWHNFDVLILKQFVRQTAQWRSG
jgi:HpcH/HpaI aldolase/citrate lyase family